MKSRIMNRIIIISIGISACLALQCTTLQERYKKFYPADELFTFGKFDPTEFLIPNEQKPINNSPHLNFAGNKKSGRLIAAGSERSFMALALCENCTGLIGRDVNPRIKAYNDFNLLLLSLATDRGDYLALRDVENIVLLGKAKTRFIEKALAEKPDMTLSEYVELAKGSYPTASRLLTIRKRLEESDMDVNLKTYFLRHLENMAEIYFAAQTNQTMLPFLEKNETYFTNANYLFDDALFNSLKDFVSRGEIIFTLGDINDLSDFSGEEILAIDVSNIPGWAILTYGKNPQIAGNNVRVIWTDRLTDTLFYSYVPELAPRSALSWLEKGEELGALLKSIGKDLPTVLNELAQKDPFNAIPAGLNTVLTKDSDYASLLAAVKKYLAE